MAGPLGVDLGTSGTSLASLLVHSVARIFHVQDMILLRSSEKSILQHFSLAEYTGAPPDEDQGIVHWYWLFGVVATLVGATLTTAGLLVQKGSHLLHTPEVLCSGSASWAYWMRSTWMLGALLWILGSLICWLGAGLAPQSVVAVMDGWNIVVAMALAPWCLGESVSRRTWCAAVLLIAGCLWVIIAGPKAYHPATAAKLIQACSKPMMFYAGGCSSAFLICMGVVAYSKWNRSSCLTPFQFTLVSANFAWYASVLSKSIAALMISSAPQQLHGSYRLIAMFLFAFLCVAVLQIHFLNLGLKYGTAVIVIPAYMAMSMLGQIVIGGIVFFDEFHGASLTAQLWFWPGVVLSVCGVAVLNSSQDQLPKMDSFTGSTERTPLVDKSGARAPGKTIPRASDNEA